MTIESFWANGRHVIVISIMNKPIKWIKFTIKKKKKYLGLKTYLHLKPHPSFEVLIVVVVVAASLSFPIPYMQW